MKNSYYFPHDFHAHDDPKCLALIKDFGMAGYGLYWCLVEIIHEQNGKIKKFPKLFDGLAYRLGIEKDNLTKQIEAMLDDYNLFQEDENYIWSERILRNIKEREEKYKAKAEAGRLGGVKSGESRKTKKTKQKTKQNEAETVLLHSITDDKTKQNEALLQTPEAKRTKGKESKLKESKLKNDLVVDTKVSTGAEAPKEKFGNPQVQFVLDTFQTTFGFPPTDAKPRREAWNIVQRTNTFLKKLGREPTMELFHKTIIKLFERISEKEYADKIEKLSVIRLKSVMYFIIPEDKDTEVE